MPDDLTQTATPTPAQREEPQAPVAPRRPAARRRRGTTRSRRYARRVTQEQGERPTAETLTSGEMVRASGLSIKALRLYDANGLLVPARVDPRTGYRAYAPEQVERGRALALLRRIDVPLARVPEVLDADPRDVRDVLLGWWDEQQQALAEQRATAEELARRLAVRRGDAEVRWREVPACTVATITSSTTQADLVPTFSADLLTIRAHHAAAGAEAGAAHWVIYHSPVGRDVPGRVVACVPYRGAVVPAVGRSPCSCVTRRA